MVPAPQENVQRLDDHTFNGMIGFLGISINPFGQPARNHDAHFLGKVGALVAEVVIGHMSGIPHINRIEVQMQHAVAFAPHSIICKL